MTLGPDWRKSTHSHTNGCIEARWVKATASGANNCGEIAHRPGYAVVRDSKDPAGPTVPFTPAAWASLLMDVAAGHFHWSRFAPLQFDATERRAFEAGVIAEEFELPQMVEPKPLYPELADDLKRAGEQVAQHKAGLAEDRSEVRAVPEAQRAVWGPTSVTGMGWDQDAADEANRRAAERREQGAAQ